MAVVGLFRIAIVRLALAHGMASNSCLQSPQHDGLQEDVVNFLQMPSLASQDDVEGCGLEMVTTYFTTKKDWQRKRSAPVDFQMMKDYYDSARKLKINVTIIYDELPEKILQYADDEFKFVQVNLTDYDALEGMNDVRFVIIDDIVKQHPEWRSIFLTDLFDSTVQINPCGHMSAGKLYVGSEKDKLHQNAWMRKRFLEMGGKYLKWFDEKPSKYWPLLSAGIVGGQREIFSQFLGEMRAALSDPELTVRVNGTVGNMNMAAFNYVIRESMGLEQNDTEGYPGLVTGFPIHSRYKMWEDGRKDVWFVHK